MNDSYCPHPFYGLDIDNDGSLMPCCKFRPREYPGWKPYNIKQGMKSYLDSDQLQSLRQDFLQGNKPAACTRCWSDEAAGVKSKRQLDLNRYQDKIQRDDGVLFLSIPIGNLCNLKCRICSPHASSSWIKEHSDLFGSKVSVQNWHQDPTVWAELTDTAKQCLELHIHGGEPFLYSHAEHIGMIDSVISSGAAANMRLHYITNGTVWPDERLWQMWNNFQQVDIQISIDDIGKRFEYNRHPASWAKVEANLKQYVIAERSRSNLQISISTTVSAFTIYYLEEMFDQLVSMGVARPWLGRLHAPHYFRAGVFHDSTKQLIKRKLMRSKYINVRAASAWLDEDAHEHYDKFVEMIKLQDNYRKEDFSSTFPELVDIMN